MNSNTEKVVVPYDFTEKADFAVEHAAIVAKNRGAEVVLLHIIKKDDKSSELEGKLTALAEKFHNELNVPVSAYIKEGTIFKTINEVVEELDAILVVMGTHGMKGMQKITGSWALKVIVGCHVPYLIVQKKPQYPEKSNILFPVDAKLETKEKLKWVGMLNSLSDTNIILFAQEGNGPMYDAPIKANMSFCKRYLKERNLSCEEVWVGQRGSFYELSLKYAQENDIDMIMITTTRDISFQDYVLGAYEQTVIANGAGLPVLVVNPRPDVKLGYTNF